MSEKTSVRDRGHAFGPQDLGAGIDQRPAAGDAAVGRQGEIALAAMPRGAIGGDQNQQCAHLLAPLISKRFQRVGPGPDHIGIQRVDRPGPRSGSAARSPPPVSRISLVRQHDIAPCQMRGDLVGAVMRVDHDARDPRVLGQRERVDQRPASTRIRGLGSVSVSGRIRAAPRQTASGIGEAAALRLDPFKPVWGGGGQGSGGPREPRQRRMRKVALQRGPGARDQIDILRLAALQAKPGKDAQDPQCALSIRA